MAFYFYFYFVVSVDFYFAVVAIVVAFVDEGLAVAVEGVAVADVLFTQQNGDINYDFTGKLSYSWPASASQTKINRYDDDYQPLLPYGFGLSYGDDNVLADNLAVNIKKSATSLQSITLFESAIKAPWKMMITDTDSFSTMTSSIIENKAVYLRTIDREVQEDARCSSKDGSR